MADDLNGLGSEDLWRPQINWREAPEFDFDFARQILEFPGTSHQVIEVTEDKPVKHSFAATMLSKADEYTLIEKFHEFMGRHKRFWFTNPLNLFTLNGWHGSGASALTCVFNYFEYRGYERIYILLKNGDLLTHKVTDFSENEANQTMELTLNDTMDRDLDPDDIAKFSLLHLSRLDIDTLELNHKSCRVAETNIRVTELPQEYSEI